MLEKLGEPEPSLTGGILHHPWPQRSKSLGPSLKLPSRELTYPTLGKGKSSSKVPILGGYVSFLEGNSKSTWKVMIGMNILISFWCVKRPIFRRELLVLRRVHPRKQTLWTRTGPKLKKEQHGPKPPIFVVNMLTETLSVMQIKARVLYGFILPMPSETSSHIHHIP